MDLRLRRRKLVDAPLELGRVSEEEDEIEAALSRGRARDSERSDPHRRPRHFTRALAQYFPKATPPKSLILDLGCGESPHRAICEEAGFQYVGVDYSSPSATLLADAHALPFLDRGFDAILSVAVLEHLKYPFVAAREAHRVLRPGGEFVGTVAFLEPFHSGSYYHHTHLGTFNSLKTAGFRVQLIAANERWSVLHAQSGALFPRLPASAGWLLVMPLYLIHRAWWKVGRLFCGTAKADEAYRALSTAGSFTFVATKE